MLYAVSPLPSLSYVSVLVDIWHMSSSLNTGNVGTFDTTGPSPTNGFGGLEVNPFLCGPRSAYSVRHPPLKLRQET
jgi:hypothetical protein